MTSRVLAAISRPAGWAALAALAALALLAGYIDLSRGGTTAAPLLLVLGYCVLVPIAIARWPGIARPGARARGANAPDGAAAYRPSYRAAAIAALAIFVLYLATLAPSTAMWDTSEYIAATYVLGLPHPPGNPLFMLLGHTFGLIPLPVSYAARINVMAALASAVSAGIWFLLTERVLAGWLPMRWQRMAGGAAAALVGATAFTVWNQSVVNEKVYTVALAGIAIISWLMFRWCDAPDAPRSDRLLVLVAYLLGLGYANHPAGFLALPAAGIAILVRRPAVLLRWRLVLVAAGVLVLGLTPFAYEPIRAAYFPPMNEGEPTACARTFAWSCTFDHLTYRRLADNINRVQYQKPSVVERQAPFTAQLGMWWMYFKWQWLRDADAAHPALQNFLAVVFFALGLVGGAEHWRRDRTTFWYFAPLIVTLTLALIFYLNFKYSWSQAPELGSTVPREPRDRDYFYLWSYSAWSVWVALGLAWLWESIAALIAPSTAAASSGGGGAGAAPAARAANARGWRRAAPVLALACIPLVGNAHQAPRRGQYITRDWAADMLDSVEPYAILVTNGDNDTFPLWYAQDVEGIRRDVSVVVGTYLGTDWFVRQLIRRPIADYDAAAGPALYRGRSWTKPDRPPLAMTFAEADSIPPYVTLPQPQLFRKGNIVARIPAGYLGRDQLVVLHLIRDAFPERPIYFAGPSYAETMGLGPYLLTQGLVDKLCPDSVVAGRDTLQVAGSFLDLPRTRALWNTVYTGPEELIREHQWVDRASDSVPFNYLVVGELLANGLAQTGDTTAGRAVVATIDRIARATRLTSVLAGASP